MATCELNKMIFFLCFATSSYNSLALVLVCHYAEASSSKSTVASYMCAKEQ